MHRHAKNYLLAAALASSLVLVGRRAPADSLVTTDGDIMVGSVTRTATGYTIKTDNGPVTLPAEKVKRVLYDHPPADPPPAATPPNPRKLKTLNALLEEGQTAFASAEFTDARDAFKDALTLDPKNATAGRGLGFAYIALGSTPKAIEPLEIAALSPPLDRSLALALSSALVANHNPMRAVRYLKTYLEAHGSPVDETMLNALGIALSQADASAAKSSLFKDAVKLYLKLNAALETTRPGKRRWGVEWEAAADVTAKEAVRQKVQNKVDAAWTKLQDANDKLQLAQGELRQLQNNPLGSGQGGKINKAQGKVNQATAAQATAQSEYSAAETELAATPKAEFPKVIAVANSDLATFALASPSSATGAIAVASATPSAPKPSAAPRPAADSTSPKPAAADPEPAAPAAPKHLTRYAVAFAIAPDVLVTSFSAVDGATAITVQTTDGKSMPATIVQTHQGDGLALLKVDGASFPSLLLAGTMSDATVSCMSFPEVDLFNPLPRSMPVIAGPATDSWTVHFETSPRLPGGPLIQNGAVVGVELGDRDSDPSAIPAATLKMLTSLATDSAHGGSLTVDPKQAVVQVMAER